MYPITLEDVVCVVVQNSVHDIFKKGVSFPATIERQVHQFSTTTMRFERHDENALLTT